MGPTIAWRAAAFSAALPPDSRIDAGEEIRPVRLKPPEDFRVRLRALVPRRAGVFLVELVCILPRHADRRPGWAAPYFRVARLGSEPLPPAEEHEHDRPDDPHEDERAGESRPTFLPPKRDVHPIRAGDQTQRAEDRCDDRERLHDLVRAVVPDVQVAFHRARAALAERVDSAERLDHVIVDAPQVVPRLLPEHGEVRPREWRERVPLGPELVPEDEQVPPEPMDRVRGLAARIFERLLFEFVQDVLQAVEVRQGRGDEGVQERVSEGGRPRPSEGGGCPFYAGPR